MRSGTGVTHLCTEPPHLRSRALARHNVDDDNNNEDCSDQGSNTASDEERCPSDDSSDGAGDNVAEDGPTAKALRFQDGTIEQYQNRPINSSAASDDDAIGDLAPTSGVDWNNMTYPYFHRHYRVVLKSKIPAADTKRGTCYPHTDAGETIQHPKRYVVQKIALKDAPQPVAIPWLLPDKHGKITTLKICRLLESIYNTSAYRCQLTLNLTTVPSQVSATTTSNYS